MKLPSLHHVIDSTGKTIFRFPFETLCAIVATVCAQLQLNRMGDEQVLSKVAMCASLGLVVFLSTSLFFQRSTRARSAQWMVQSLALVLLIGYYFTFSSEPREIELLRFAVLNICFHLAVSFAGFMRPGLDVQAFWEFNKRLFLRILTAGIYSGFLFAGLSLAIVAVDKLFDLEINDRIFGELFFTIAGIFNTLFFLSGVPVLATDTLETDYPKGLKAFTQYVLIPLVSIYLLILLAYETKIVAMQRLPYGWVSILILVFAIFGMLSQLLIYPVRNLAGNRWMNTFNNWFYYLLVPLLGLLYWAILYRIGKYGFTPERYYVFVLALWLTLMVAYFLFTRTPDIKFIPLSLCITGLLTIYGPQGAQYVSKVSQLHRFVDYIHQQEVAPLSETDQQELSSVVDYIRDYHGSAELVAAAAPKLDTAATPGRELTSRQVMHALGLVYYPPHSSRADSRDYFSVYASPSNVFDVSAFDIAAKFESYELISCDSCLQLKGKNYALHTSKESGQLIITINNDRVSVDLNTFVNTLKPQSGVPYTQAELTQVVETGSYTITLLYTSVSGNFLRDAYTVTGYSGMMGITVKQ